MSRDPAFNPTRWSLIAVLRNGEGPRVQEALETLCRAYWYPLYAYARRCGQAPDDAADLTQAFFAHLIEKEIFAQANPERGRLRNYLLTAMQNFLRDNWRRQQRQKRGGGSGLPAIDEVVAERRYALEPADVLTPEKLYHRRWALTLLERTVSDVRDDYARRGQSALFETLKPTLTGDSDAGSAAELGAQLGMEAATVRVAISRLRARYRERLLAEVAASMDAHTEQEVDEEIDALFRALS
jgi:RNA polymerase sigma-70 factor (ECF subfamily)